MGAAASVKMLYSDALSWFKTYIDSETYMADFTAMNTKHDGNITIVDFQKWIAEKAKVESVWSIFNTNPQILLISYKNATLYDESDVAIHTRKVVDFTAFKALLVHLFATSVLWSHFSNAQSWDHEGSGSQQLSYETFRIACKTICETHAHEHLTDDQIKEDFSLLDKNDSGQLSFMEVCNYCCRFIHPSFDNKSPRESSIQSMKKAKFFGVESTTEGSDVAAELQSGPKQYFEGYTADEKSTNAIEALKMKLEQESELAQDFTTRVLSEELSATTEASGSTENVKNVAVQAVSAISEAVESGGDATNPPV